MGQYACADDAQARDDGVAAPGVGVVQIGDQPIELTYSSSAAFRFLPKIHANTMLMR